MAALGGGGGHYGAPFKMVDNALQDATAIFKKLGPHKGLPKLGDIPLLIKSLSVAERAVAREAHDALVWLSGMDLGTDPQPWLAWWSEESPRQAHRKRNRKSARDMFGGFKSDVLTGRWESAASRLSRRLREKQSASDCIQFMRQSGRLLRKVYRDARIASLQLSGDSGQITVDWGELGFEFKGIRLVREGGSWQLDSFPWGKKVSVQKRDIAQSNDVTFSGSDPTSVESCQPISRRRRRGSLSAGTVGSVLAALGLIFGFLYLMEHSSSGTGNTIFYALAMVGIVSVPISVFYCMFFGRVRKSRDIIEDLRRHRGNFAPNARGRR
jgi:hypothetical protein